MRTFASAFTLPSGGNWWNNSATLTTKSKWNTKLTSPGVIVDAKNEAHIQELLSNGGIKLNFTARNEMFSTLIPGNSVNNSNGDMEEIDTTLGSGLYHFENGMRFDDAAISVFNQYKFVFGNQLEDLYQKSVVADAEEGSNTENATKYAVAETLSSQHVPSLFNPYFAVDVIGISHNIPIYNNIESYKPLSSQVENYDVTDFEGGKQAGKGENQIQPKVQQYQTDIAASANSDFTDCSIKTLVALSNDFSEETQAPKELGQERFKYADFMFCKDVGRISNNYLITLRRFGSPIGDDITCQPGGTLVAPDVGRMLCYIGEDNKLEDILKYQYNTSWRPLTSKIEEKPSEEDSPDRGIIGSVVNLANPSYIKAVTKGAAGSGNHILGWVSNHALLGKVFNNKGTYEGSDILGMYDNNRVYEQQDTVQDTHIYEGKLKFSQEFTLTFNYEMRAYDNINPRTAFLDLLANVHVVTYRQGTFWAGERRFKGVSGNPQGWAKANAFIDKAWDKLGGFCEGLLTGNIDWQSVWGSISSAFGSAGKIVGEAANTAKDIATGNGGQNKHVRDGLQKWKQGGYSDAFKGMLKNRLGRPAMYAWQSLLSGDPVGFHHVTIGNPRAPIMSIGNLIITNTTVQHYGPLGIDDFPTGLKVTVSLKHAKSRDAIDIQHMYTGGKGALAVGFTGIKKIEDYYNFGVDINNKGQTNRTYYSTNGTDSLEMKYENGNWVVYETKSDGKPTKVGTYTGNDPAAHFEKTLTKRNQQIMNWNEEYADEEHPAKATFGNGGLSAVKYGLVTGDATENIMTRFGTNNIDQIVANAAIYARRT